MPRPTTARRLCTWRRGWAIRAWWKALLAGKANVNAKANSGVTPLYSAALNGHKDVAEVLLANNANVNAETNNGEDRLCRRRR